MKPTPPDSDDAGRHALKSERFHVFERLGFGGSSEVYRAHDLELAMDVALKVLAAGQGERSHERFLTEALIGQRLNHPNIVRVHGLIREFEVTRPALVMELVEGESLKDRLLSEVAINDLGEALRILRAVGEALRYAHENGVIHRDVKPSNILLAKDGTVKLTDFGVARTELFDSALTQTGELLGSFGYIAPEVLEGEEATAQSDIYSLGVVAFELLGGKLSAEGASRVLAGAQSFNFPKHTPAWLVVALQRCLAKDSEKRVASASEFLQLLERPRFCFGALKSAFVYFVGTIATAFVLLIVVTEKYPQFAKPISAIVLPGLDNLGIDGLRIAYLAGLELGSSERLSLLAAHDGDIEVLRYLFERRGVDKVISKADRDRVFCAAVMRQHVESVRFLLKRGFSATTRCEQIVDSLSLLSWAVMHRDMNLVKLFLEDEATLSVSDIEPYKHPLFVAIVMKHLPSFKAIMKNRKLLANPVVGDRSALYEIVKDKDTRRRLLPVFLASGANLHARVTAGLTALHLASEGCDVTATRRLLRLGLSPNARSSSGQTPLLSICARQTHPGRPTIFGLLLGFGADVNASDPSGMTLLMRASESGDLELVRLLRESSGINLMSRDEQGRTAFYYAMLSDRSEVADALLGAPTN